jgi:hypothetical protein
MQLFYGMPSDNMINKYIEEVITLLLGSYLDCVSYGFRMNGSWVIALKYVVRFDGSIIDDNRSGRVLPGVDITGASWYSFLEKSTAFWQLPEEKRAMIERSLPIQRTHGEEPKIINGTWVTDKSYSSGGVAVQRRTFKPF